jgi:RNA polymerase sigma-70 factor (ECF subfamily)
MTAPLSCPTPRSLLERLRQPGDQAAWERFVELYTPLLFVWSRRLGLQSADAADRIQELFSSLVQTLPAFHYDPSRRFRGWLWTVFRNRVRTWQSQQPDVAQRPDLDTLPEADPADALMEAEYRRHLVGRALQVMRTDFEESTWRACWECVAQDRPAAEVARELGISVEAVYQAKSRVLARLRQELDGLLE